MAVEAAAGLGLSGIAAHEDLVEQGGQAVVLEQPGKLIAPDVKVAHDHELPPAGFGGQGRDDVVVDSLGQTLHRQLDLGRGLHELVRVVGQRSGERRLHQAPHLGRDFVQPMLGVEPGLLPFPADSGLGLGPGRQHRFDRGPQLVAVAQESGNHPLDLLAADTAGDQRFEKVDQNYFGVLVGDRLSYHCAVRRHWLGPGFRWCVCESSLIMPPEVGGKIE
jgi:hypothetical protein